MKANSIPSFAAAVFFIALFPEPSLCGPVEDAYRSIPHKQTTYSAGKSKLLSTNSKAVEKVLALSDQALVERVEAGAWLLSGGTRGRNFSDYESRIKAIVAELESLKTPESLEPAKRLIIEAIEDQRIFLVQQFKLAYASKGYRWPADYRDDPNIQRAHMKLIQAHQILTQAYPEEGSHNKDAFFDHLCALDYL